VNTSTLCSSEINAKELRLSKRTTVLNRARIWGRSLTAIRRPTNKCKQKLDVLPAYCDFLTVTPTWNQADLQAERARVSANEFASSDRSPAVLVPSHAAPLGRRPGDPNFFILLISVVRFKTELGGRPVRSPTSQPASSACGRIRVRSESLRVVDALETAT